MTKNVVRIQFERFKPGETAIGHGIDLYIHPPRNYVWYPQQPKFTMLDDPDGVHTLGHPGKLLRFDEGGLLFRFDALGVETDGITKGNIDALMSGMPASKLFKDDLLHLAEMAQYRLDIFQPRALWAMLAVYEVDLHAQTVTFEASLELDEVLADEPI